MNLVHHLQRFALLITTLADNAAFVAVLTAWPNINAKWLVLAHLVAMVAKSYYYMDKKQVTVEPSTEEPKRVETRKEDDSWLNESLQGTKSS